jgi:hypothetical protein
MKGVWVMFFQTILVALLAILLGAALSFAGYRFFMSLLPSWAFFAGFSATATAITGFWGTAFLATITSWVIGILVGLLFAALAGVGVVTQWQLTSSQYTLEAYSHDVALA